MVISSNWIQNTTIITWIQNNAFSLLSWLTKLWWRCEADDVDDYDDDGTRENIMFYNSSLVTLFLLLNTTKTLCNMLLLLLLHYRCSCPLSLYTDHLKWWWRYYKSSSTAIMAKPALPQLFQHYTPAKCDTRCVRKYMHITSVSNTRELWNK